MKRIVIDCHTHIGAEPANDEGQTAEEVIREMDEAGIDKAVVTPFYTNPRIEQANKYILNSTKKFTDRFIPFFASNPSLDNMIDLMHKYKEEGFRGAMIDSAFIGRDFRTVGFREFIECCIELGLVTFIHDDNVDSSRINVFSMMKIFELYPEAKFIISSWYHSAPEIVAKYKNTYIDTVAFPTGEAANMRGAVLTGCIRMVMGSGSPQNYMAFEKRKFEIDFSFTEFQKSLIMGRNAQRLFGL